MNRLFLLALCLGALMVYPSRAQIYSMDKAIKTGQLAGTDSTIHIRSEHPESLTIFGYDFQFPDMYRCDVTGEKSWVEFYTVARTSCRLLLHKDGIQGLTKIEFLMATGKSHIFYPRTEPLQLSFVPAAIINRVDMETVSAPGNRKQRIAPRITYRSFISDSTVLYVRILTEYGKLLRDENSPHGYTYSVTVPASGELYCTELLTSWPGKSDKEYRMEIYDNQGCKLSDASLSSFRRVMHIPIVQKCTNICCGVGVIDGQITLLERENNNYSVRKQNPYSRARRFTQFDYERFYTENATHVPGLGNIIGWREVER